MTTTPCIACGQDQADQEHLLAAARECNECAALVADFERISAAVDTNAAIASAGVDPEWTRNDDALFLAHFRDRLQRSTAGAEDLWRWLAVRLWPVSAGLLLGAFFALGERGQESPVDLEGMTLAYESSQAEIEPDALGDFLAPALERSASSETELDEATSTEALESEP